MTTLGGLVKSEKQKMLAGEPYRADDAELKADRNICAEKLARFNALIHYEEQVAFLPQVVGETGAGSFIRPPFYCDYGYNIRLGKDVFLNFNCIILDVTGVVVGDHARVGPGVQILAADHPRDPQVRLQGLESGRPIHIGRNVWIGGGALILPGVTIGDDVIIGAGSVVTNDVASGTTVAGNPTRELRRRQKAGMSK
jgi:maltose O-acetyltransferase